MLSADILIIDQHDFENCTLKLSYELCLYGMIRVTCICVLLMFNMWIHRKSVKLQVMEDVASNNEQISQTHDYQCSTSQALNS